MILEGAKRNPAQLALLTINALRMNLLHLMFKLGQRRDYENANKVGMKAYQLMGDCLKGQQEQYYTC